MGIVYGVGNNATNYGTDTAAKGTGGEAGMRADGAPAQDWDGSRGDVQPTGVQTPPMVAQHQDSSKKRKVEPKVGGTSSAITNNVAEKGRISPNLAKANTDIYGRNPGKEPKYPLKCPNNCGRQISCKMMAMHLEKCLGLVVRRRNSSSTFGSGNQKGNTCANSSSSGTKGNASKAGGGGATGKQGKQPKRKSQKIS